MRQWKRRASNIEIKNKRVNLVIQPSLYAEVAKICYVKRQSMNGLMCELLTNYAKHNKDAAAAYDGPAVE